MRFTPIKRTIIANQIIDERGNVARFTFHPNARAASLPDSKERNRLEMLLEGPI
jgi:hypothetical protein